MLKLQHLILAISLCAIFSLQSKPAANAMFSSKNNFGKIVLLNGMSSAGKTSIVKALQNKSWQQQQQIWLALGIDKMWAMMPRDYILDNRLAEKGFKLNSWINEKHQPVAKFVYGAWGKLVATSFLQLVAHMARQGHNIILDEVLCDIDTLEPHRELFKEFNVYMVAVHRELEEAVEIEALRGDRPVGLARGQFDKVHQVDGVRYDLELNTSKQSIFSCADQVFELINQPSPCHAFNQMVAKKQFRHPVHKKAAATLALSAGKVVILHGCSSSGKTTLARALQQLSANAETPTPWLYAGIDLLWQLVPSQFIANFNDKPGQFGGLKRVFTVDSQGRPVCHIEYGPQAERIAKDFLFGLKILAGNGLNLVLDEVLHCNQTLEHHQAAFGQFNPLLVGLFCNYAEALERESLRLDRPAGLVQGQFYQVHDTIKKYDLIVNTSYQTSGQGARAILETLAQQQKTQAQTVIGKSAADAINQAAGKVADNRPSRDDLGWLKTFL